MQGISRIFKFVWPQWHRVVIIVVSAITVSILLAGSFLTVIPILKVMLGREGIHGWIDRKTCEYKYGVEFYLPEVVDLSLSGDKDYAHSLLITKVHKNSFAKSVGIDKFDKIVGAGNVIEGQPVEKTMYPKILQQLATASADGIKVQVIRTNSDNSLSPKVFELKPSVYVESAIDPNLSWYGKMFLPLKLWGNKFAWESRISGVEIGQKIVTILPREETNETKTRAIVFIIGIVTIVTIIRCIAKFWQDYMCQKVVSIAINMIRRHAYMHILNLPLSHFAKERPSDAVSRLIADTNSMGKSIRLILGKALREPLNAMFFLLFAMAINWQLAMIFLCGAPFAVGLIGILGKKMKKATKKSLMAFSEMLAKLQETMHALKIVKVYNRQEYERISFDKLNEKLLKQTLKISRVDAATQPVLEVLGMLAGAAALIVGAHWVTKSQIEPENFIALLILLGSAAESVRKTSDVWTKLQEASAAADRVFGLIDIPLETDKPNASELKPLSSYIEFQNITFTYPTSHNPVLHNVSLVVKAGQNIAIVGPNGSGKTTIVNLLPRFFDPDSGRIIIDGVDVNDVTLKSLRNQIAIVSQNMVTFRDTIAANIGYGKLEATMDEIVAASKIAHAHEFISKLPNGYDSIIGEQSTGLSGGQLQRIVIARAVLKNPSILIFDEATSQIDSDSEAKIHGALQEIIKNRTTFIIAHRFSTILNADLIVVMDHGRIIAQGKHEELAEKCMLYKNLYQTQLISG
jgi:subfamily B ATP-binding cassette protein MsbA